MIHWVCIIGLVFGKALQIPMHCNKVLRQLLMARLVVLPAFLSSLETNITKARVRILVWLVRSWLVLLLPW